MTTTPEYSVWKHMLHRCLNENTDNFKYYGGRGISLCDEWLQFENFYRDMGPRPVGTQLDRIDNDGDYGPDNCRWATKSEQMRNTSRNKRHSAFGESKCLADWADDPRCVVKYDTLKRRIRRGMLIEDALTTPNMPPGPKKK